MNLNLAFLKDYKLSMLKPEADIAICSNCHWSGNVSECDTEDDGCWEDGYYKVELCPNCEDGGCIDEYEYSEEQFKKLKEWKLKYES